ncbi:2,3-diaminopropionate biosynthesis protein SbnB [Streptomyces aureoverticillatus]|uniref:2,3-diaminopropionate biosynthesis protein SbnB n=1 Tax=Streptomyces aureoverticillatus TaxID=66871 RepID=UPI0013DBD88A|nr:2,3-diaminopropionate biosynthesis protein SbnB [Streptomyces aureoverticillatus]QIB42669.1 2,3-diaminopropionate biosynthesis protein SbnB [Streptomyces aureoverticillatus]
MFDFHVVGGSSIRSLIAESRPDIVETVRDAYLTHHDKNSVNPNSYFLRFLEKADSRIIALPAYLGGRYGVAGIKWIASFPGNIEHNVPRASAALLLNDYATGYPFACLEASQISAARTAASAVLGAEQLVGGRSARRVAVVGAGVIARNIVEFFRAQEWSVGGFVVHDRSPEYAERLTRHIIGLGYGADREDSFAHAVDGADVVVFATTAGEPWVTEPGTFTAGQTVLNISLRDIGPRIVAGAQNILDDIDHCMTANTSPHLAEQELGHRDFVDGTLAQMIRGEVRAATDKPRIFSPFGLGVLDLAVGLRIYRRAVESGRAVNIPGFFGETERW